MRRYCSNRAKLNIDEADGFLEKIVGIHQVMVARISTREIREENDSMECAFHPSYRRGAFYIEERIPVVNCRALGISATGDLLFLLIRSLSETPAPAQRVSPG